MRFSHLVDSLLSPTSIQYSLKHVHRPEVSMDVMKPWIAKRITEMLGFEDDIVVESCWPSLLLFPCVSP